jgi:predicted dehydrogenase
MLKIGVVGTGHLGKIHLQNLLELTTDFSVQGFYDTDAVIASEVVRDFNLKAFDHLDTLLVHVDAILISSPTHTHFSIAIQALKSGKHVFIEKPVCINIEESNKLLRYAQEAGMVVQVGHVERFNPALIASMSFIDKPLFMEAQRSAPFQTRGTDVSVVYDLMIHDIDIALNIAHSNVKKIASFGMQVLSESIDMASVRLEFENGCVANLSASRVSQIKERKTTFYMEDAQLTVDFLKKEAERNILMIDSKGQRSFVRSIIPVEDTNAIQSELSAFAESIRASKIPTVSLTDAHRALQIAELISEQIKESNHFLQ